MKLFSFHSFSVKALAVGLLGVVATGCAPLTAPETGDDILKYINKDLALTIADQLDAAADMVPAIYESTLLMDMDLSPQMFDEYTSTERVQASLNLQQAVDTLTPQFSTQALVDVTVEDMVTSGLKLNAEARYTQGDLFLRLNDLRGTGEMDLAGMVPQELVGQWYNAGDMMQEEMMPGMNIADFVQQSMGASGTLQIREVANLMRESAGKWSFIQATGPLATQGNMYVFPVKMNEEGVRYFLKTAVAALQTLGVQSGLDANMYAMMAEEIDMLELPQFAGEMRIQKNDYRVVQLAGELFEPDGESVAIVQFAHKSGAMSLNLMNPNGDESVFFEKRGPFFRVLVDGQKMMEGVSSSRRFELTMYDDGGSFDDDFNWVEGEPEVMMEVSMKKDLIQPFMTGTIEMPEEGLRIEVEKMYVAPSTGKSFADMTLYFDGKRAGEINVEAEVIERKSITVVAPANATPMMDLMEGLMGGMMNDDVYMGEDMYYEDEVMEYEMTDAEQLEMMEEMLTQMYESDMMTEDEYNEAMDVLYAELGQ